MGSTGSAGGLETLYFDVPGDDRLRTTLQVKFDHNHEVTDAEFRLLKAAAWLTAAVLELEKPARQPADRPAPIALLRTGSVVGWRGSDGSDQHHELARLRSSAYEPELHGPTRRNGKFIDAAAPAHRIA